MVERTRWLSGCEVPMTLYGRGTWQGSSAGELSRWLKGKTFLDLSIESRLTLAYNTSSTTIGADIEAPFTPNERYRTMSKRTKRAAKATKAAVPAVAKATPGRKSIIASQTKAETEAQVTKLLAQLAESTDAGDKKRFRRNLRARGYFISRGGYQG